MAGGPGGNDRVHAGSISKTTLASIDALARRRHSTHTIRTARRHLEHAVVGGHRAQHVWPRGRLPPPAVACVSRDHDRRRPLACRGARRSAAGRAPQQRDAVAEHAPEPARHMGSAETEDHPAGRRRRLARRSCSRGAAARDGAHQTRRLGVADRRRSASRRVLVQSGSVVRQRTASPGKRARLRRRRAGARGKPVGICRPSAGGRADHRDDTPGDAPSISCASDGAAIEPRKEDRHHAEAEHRSPAGNDAGACRCGCGNSAARRGDCGARSCRAVAGDVLGIGCRSDEPRCAARHARADPPADQGKARGAERREGELRIRRAAGGSLRPRGEAARIRVAHGPGGNCRPRRAAHAETGTRHAAGNSPSGTQRLGRSAAAAATTSAAAASAQRLPRSAGRRSRWG